ncbi:DUF2029 domain-containing protein [Paraburkholderia pallida]|uniref:DUF2029 domain-containing protein n=2 Tax=Paraburkholderia pallida TaxID=2547399 RepID=A0A4V1AZB2_9BURK|nr:DUF2029 domain-containing protein [Paraburkholderia pallida]
MALYSGAMLVLQLILIAVWGVACWILHIRGVPLLGLDFRVFWSASFVSLQHGLIAAFDPHLLAATEARLYAQTAFTGVGYFAPWVYPPTFQSLILPLALLPYIPSYLAFVCICIALCLGACVPVMKARPLPWISVIAFPGVWVSVIYGQSSFLTFFLAASALALVKRRPLLAGVCAGLLVIKPQFGLLFPLFFLCGRQYRAFAMAAVTAILVCAINVWVFGLPLWERFFETLSWFNTTVLQHNNANLWRVMPSVYAIARCLGANLGAAYAVHFAIALPLIIGTGILWVKQPGSCLSSAAAVVATLVATPYLLSYDLVWLLLPILYLCEDFQRTGTGRSWELAIVGLAWFFPLVAFLTTFVTQAQEWGALLLPALLLTILFRAKHFPVSYADIKRVNLAGKPEAKQPF